MAAITSRLTKNGQLRWRVFFRRRGLPSFSKTFGSEELAHAWVEANEEKYILDPYSFHKFKPETMEKLKTARKIKSKNE